MTLQQLKYFITVAEIGNITYAAQRLYTSQPTISRQIQMLEAELGYRLLTTTEQHTGLENGSIDIAIGLELPHWEEAGFTVRKLKKEETLIVVSNEHRLAGKDHLEYNDLCGETFYLTSPNGYQVDKIFKDIFCLDDAHQVEVKSSEIAYFKVMSENGITISNPHDPYLLNNPYYHSIPFESEYSDSYVCVTNPDNTNPVINLFMDLIGEL